MQVELKSWWRGGLVTATADVDASRGLVEAETLRAEDDEGNRIDLDADANRVLASCLYDDFCEVARG